MGYYRGYPDCNATMDAVLADTDTAALLTSGVLFLAAFELVVGVTISSVTFMLGATVAVTPTHSWMGVFDKNRNALALTDDGLGTVPTVSTGYSRNIATIASGAASAYVVQQSDLGYLGIMFAAATTPSLLNRFPGGAVLGSAFTPIKAGASTGSLTVPPNFPFQGNALSVSGHFPLAWYN